ncbi:hypothetical protein [Methanopyrus kandleri]|uniref:Predicted membrane protein n=2 Tax=Methanopyrus kandleri TaxID=2320 RepID=Q8TWA9_METKA|nr:hypothetical protein [Methanopyrus kandleri]AAM02340.1 Predicted membrane protein [Methanopyrus kandleri AV19]HII69761.1 hypothetical protein [Methanopyrus kandleri]
MFIGVLLAPTVNLLLLISLVKLLHVKCSLQGAELIARIAPMMTLGVVPAVTVEARSLLTRIPPTATVERILTVLNVPAVFVYAFSFFILVHCYLS